jgi:hypothetical protein
MNLLCSLNIKYYYHGRYTYINYPFSISDLRNRSLRTLAETKLLIVEYLPSRHSSAPPSTTTVDLRKLFHHIHDHASSTCRKTFQGKRLELNLFLLMSQCH